MGKARMVSCNFLANSWGIMRNYNGTSGFRGKFWGEQKTEDLKPSQGPGQMISLTHIHIWLNMMLQCPIKWWHNEYLLNPWFNCICEFQKSAYLQIPVSSLAEKKKRRKWIKQYQTYGMVKHGKTGFECSNQMFATYFQALCLKLGFLSKCPTKFFQGLHGI